VTLAVAVGLAGAGPARAGDDPAARAAVERAVQAQSGGAERQARLRQLTVTSTGSYHNPLTGAATPASKEETLRLPGFYRMSVEVKAPGQFSQQVHSGIQEDQGWHSAGGMIGDMDRLTLTAVQNELYAYWVATLPLGDSRLSWEKGPDATVDGRPAVGVTVKYGKRPDVQLFFDKENGLLVKFAFQSPEAGQQILKEFVLSNYRDFGGIKLPTKRVDSQLGKTVAEWQINDYKFHDRLDEKVFAKP
jgi:hypothetical protein